MIGLPTSANKFPNQLSGGQQQRVRTCTSVGIITGLLLLDEPLSALDAKVRTHLRDEICQMQRRLGHHYYHGDPRSRRSAVDADRIVS